MCEASHLLVGLVDLTHDSVIVWNCDDQVLLWNAGAQALYGWPVARALGTSVHLLLKTQFPMASKKVWSLLVAKGQWDGEVTRSTASGVEVVVQVRWVLRTDPEGNPQSIVETGRDVTAGRQASEALQRTESRYRILFKAMAASFWELDFSDVGEMLSALGGRGVTDLRGYLSRHPEFVRQAMAATRVIDVNEKSVQLFGARSRDDMLTDVAPFWPEGSEHVYAESLVAAVEGRPHYEAETRLATLDGREIDVLFTVCYPHESRIGGTFLVGIIDISERKQSERALTRSEYRYRSLFQAMSVAFFEVDFSRVRETLEFIRASGVTDLHNYVARHPSFVEMALESTTVVDVNEKAIQLFGAQSKADLLGSVIPFWPEASRSIYLDSIAANFNDRWCFEAETRMRTIDGRELDVLFTAYMPPDNPNPGSVLVGVIDVSERVASREELLRIQAEFAHASRVSMLGELSASIAHEVNQPLTAIAVNSEASLRWLDRAQPDTEEVRRLTGRIAADARRAADIIARIRTMSVNKAPERRAISPTIVIEEAVAFLRHEIQARNVSMRLELMRDAADVLADRTQLQQVLVNLAMNGMQAMDQCCSGERQMVIRSRSERGMALIEVEDNGTGIAPEHRDSLFNSFFTTKSSGMGIGLSLCRSIIEAHGGHIWFDAERDSGASVLFSIPEVWPAVQAGSVGRFHSECHAEPTT